eukprot:scaffold52285_cov23-Cyclotella_meneghiniana.AAC.1
MVHVTTILINNPTHRRLLIAFAILAIRFFPCDEEKLLVKYTISSSSSLYQEPMATVAYAISLTNCGPKFNPFDTAAVLKRSIELNSWPKHPESRYASEFFAFVKTSNAALYNYQEDRCGQLLSLAGWTIIPKEDTVNSAIIKEPQGSILKGGISRDGCCGSSELIKLETYKLPHAIAVHLDLDTLVTNPFDELYNVMHFSPDTKEGKQARKRLVDVVAPTYLNRRTSGHPSQGNVTATEAENLLSNITVNAFYTKDYNMINPSKGHNLHVGVQGGFLVVKTSDVTYLQLLDMVYSGEFYGGFDGKTGGWFKSGYGKHIWGSMTIQGLMGHFFDHVELEHSVELNRCRYNNIADNARVSTFSTNPKFPRGTLIDQARNESNPRFNYKDLNCRDGRVECNDTDCQRFPIKKTRLVHYTYCKHPTSCMNCDYMETYKEVSCYSFMKEWFRVRSTILGESLPNNKKDIAFSTNVQWMQEDGKVDVYQGNCYKEYTMGFCQGEGKYLFMKVANMSLLTE